MQNEINIIETVESRKELATYLRRGDRAKIAKLAKVSRRTVESFLEGKILKSVVEAYFLTMAQKRKEQVEAEVAELLETETLN